MTQPIDLTVSLIVHEDFAHIRAALESLYAHTRAPFACYVIVNAGSRTETERLREAFPAVCMIVNAKPQGFAYNHNLVMRLAGTPFVALLNDDVRLEAGALDAMLDYLKANPRVGLAGAALLNPDGTPQVSVYNDPILPLTLYKVSGLGRFTAEGTALRRWLQSVNRGRIIRAASWQTQDADCQVEVVKGAAMLVRRDAYLQVGLMDESTRMYGEEIDWHLRFRKAGWSIAYVANARIIHYGIGQRIHLGTLIEDRRSLLNYYLKHRPYWQAVVLRSSIIGVHLIRALVESVIHPQRARAHLDIARMAATWHGALAMAEQQIAQGIQ
jgi:GT2 family glycosyltransferase